MKLKDLTGLSNLAYLSIVAVIVGASYFCIITWGPWSDTNHVGAYQVLLESSQQTQEYKGVLVIEQHTIWADGERIEVANWLKTDGGLVAESPDGSRLMSFKVTQQPYGLVQEHPDGSQLILQKFSF